MVVSTICRLLKRSRSMCHCVCVNIACVAIYTGSLNVCCMHAYNSLNV